MKALSKMVYKDGAGEPSSSKLWFTLTNTAILYTYTLIGITLSKSPTPDLIGWAVLTFAIAAIVTGNKLANQVIKLKFGAGVNNELVSTDKKSDSNKTTDSVGNSN